MDPNLDNERRRMVCKAVAALTLAPAAAWAQQRLLPPMVKMIVPFSPGAANDLFARALAKRISTRLNTNVIVDNRPGGGGSIGTLEAARSAPDGATTLLTSVSFATDAAIKKKLPYDPIRSFTPVAMVARGPMLVVVNGRSRFKTLDQLVAEGKAPNASVTYGSAGPGSIAHMSTELLNTLARTSLRHVPYRGVANAVTDLLGGQIDMLITTVASVRGHIQSGALRGLATTSARRSRLADNLAPVSETVPGYAVEAWWGVFAPAKTADATVQALNAEIVLAGKSSEFRELYEREGTEAGAMSSAEFAAFVQEELGRWRRLADTRKIEVD